MLPYPLEPLIDRLGGSFSRDHQESGVTWGPGDHNGRPKFERLTSSRKSPGLRHIGYSNIRKPSSDTLTYSNFLSLPQIHST